MTDKNIPKVGYVSDADLFLRDLEKNLPKTSDNRKAEESKYRAINSLRDDKNSNAVNATSFL